MGVISYIRKEIDVIKKRDPAIRSAWEVLIYPGFQALLYYRIAHRFYKQKHYFLARWLSQRAAKKTRIEIHPGAVIGEGCFIDHGCGIVIGETAVIGNHVTLYQGVTLGGTGKEQGKRHPTLQDHVLVGAGTQILGALTIGHHTKIGAGCVVLKDIPAYCTVVGDLGKIVKVQQPEIQTMERK